MQDNLAFMDRKHLNLCRQDRNREAEFPATIRRDFLWVRSNAMVEKAAQAKHRAEAQLVDARPPKPWGLSQDGIGVSSRLPFHSRKHFSIVINLQSRPGWACLPELGRSSGEGKGWAVELSSWGDGGFKIQGFGNEGIIQFGACLDQRCPPLQKLNHWHAVENIMVHGIT
jgi:hypothetical protein